MTGVDFRVLCWNLHGLRDDRALLLSVIRSCDPDLVCVQEAPKYLRWRSRCAALARESGLLYVTGGGTTGGSALLAHLRVDVARSAQVCLSRQWGWPARGVAAAVVSKAGARLAIASVHLPLRPPERLDHAQRVLAVLAGLGATHGVVAGDLNERPGRAAWQALHDGGLRDPAPGSGPTFPAAAPNRRIDAVLAGERVECVEYAVVDAPEVARASDHRPVLAVVRVPDS